jgi:hypothetical protein
MLTHRTSAASRVDVVASQTEKSGGGVERSGAGVFDG